MTISEKLAEAIRDVHDFPKPGIVFKDITPILEMPELCKEINQALLAPYHNKIIDAVIGVESRGFFFGMMMAQSLQVPFIPVRKAGKLPYKTISHAYDLEYGSAVVEMHIDTIKPGWNVIIHDDLLATGGTAGAAAALVLKQSARIAGFSFIVGLSFLDGKEKLLPYDADIQCLIEY
ncbi:MAG: adenine phosphoribosyltransferase [Flavobacteriales bacterium]